VNASVSSRHRDDIPSHVLDQAIAWLVTLQSGTADTAMRSACEAWRAADPIHERTWQALQAVEQEFRTVSPVFREHAFKTLETAQRHRGIDKRRRKALKLLGVCATGVAVSQFVAGQSPWRHWTAGLGADYVTATGERRAVDLADGTQLMLNTATAVDVKFAPDLRLIILRQGEIFISTGKDVSSSTGRRPFLVETAQGRFEAIGTRFLVRQEESQTRLRVEEGAVALPAKAAGSRVIAESGQEFVVGGAGPMPVTESRFDAIGWIDGALVAKQMRLEDFLAELSHYREGWLRCDPGVADLRVSGVFQLDDTDHVLDALTRSLPVRIERRTRYWVRVIQS
jgi:ferric-dicitrate binding protein FerR (iron transport regulator)